MVEQEGHPVVDVARVDDVVVVEHQHDLASDGAQLVEQDGQHRFDRRRLGRLQAGQRARADAGRHRLQRGDQVGPEGHGIVVGLVEREPRDQPFTGGVAGPAASHSASSVVLPKPAGAETSVSFDAAPRSSRSLSRGRGTRPRRDRGM